MANTNSDKIDSLYKWRASAEERLKEYHEFLFGNGEKVGLDERIRNIERGVTAIIRLGWMVVGVLVTIGISGIVSATVYLIKVMPK